QGYGTGHCGRSFVYGLLAYSRSPLLWCLVLSVFFPLSLFVLCCRCRRDWTVLGLGAES
ncbi:hypothetical protein AALO_G00262600, partial [Alosa alosa]